MLEKSNIDKANDRDDGRYSGCGARAGHRGSSDLRSCSQRLRNGLCDGRYRGDCNWHKAVISASSLVGERICTRLITGIVRGSKVEAI
jgi:hypothetical protein